MFRIIKKMFIGLLTSIVNPTNHTKCVSLSNQKCKTQPTFINLHPNEYIRGLRYYPFELIQIDVREVVILLITYLIKYVFQTKQKIQI